MVRGRGRKGQQRGVSLILALFTTVVLLTLSIAFIALAIGNARTSKAASHASVAQNAANWGIEFTINYMGVGPNWAIGFQGLTPVHQLEPTAAGGVAHPPASTYNVVVTQNAQNANTRDVAVTDTAVALPQGGDGALEVGADTDKDRLFATATVQVTPIVLAGGAGQVPNYQILSTAQVFDRTGAQVATRVVDVRVREGVVTDNLHFIQNGVAWDAMGVNFANPQTLAQMANRVRIPPTYLEQGPMSVVGGGSVPGTAGFLSFLGPYPGVSPTSRQFTRPLHIQQAGNQYPSGGYSDAQAKMAPPAGDGFMLAGQIENVSSPMPDSTSYLNTDNDRDGRIDQRDDGTFPAALSFNPADPEERGVLYLGSRFNVNGPPTLFTDDQDNGFYEVDPDEVVIRRPQTATPQTDDYRPGLPQIEVELNGDQVNVTKHTDVVNDPDGSSTRVNPVTGAPGALTYDLGDGDLPNHVLYVEGGNVVVTSKLDGSGNPVPFDGALTIVSSGNPANEPIAFNGNGFPRYDASGTSETMYNWLARDMLEWEKLQPIQQASDFNPPPYTAQELTDFYNTTLPASRQDPQMLADLANGGITDPTWKGNARCFYPPPAEVDHSDPTFPISTFNPATEREGNLVVGSDLAYNGDLDTVVGLLSENFILLNDHTTTDAAGNADPAYQGVYGVKPNRDVLRVDAVLFSFNHSVQFDWDNTALNSTALHGQLIQPRPANNLRQFLYNGSVIGGFLDTEGDTSGRGYQNQSFTHDPRLKDRQPPFLPRFNFTQFGPGVQIPWVIRHYVDRGALSTENNL